jgi:hypothetical protein
MGMTAAWVAAPWFLFTAAVGIYGLIRRDRVFAHGFLSVGGFWLVVARSGIPLFGFATLILLLTAVHFHFAGFGASMLAANTRRRIAWGVYAATPLLAAGITFSHTLELFAAVLFAVSLAGVALIQLKHSPANRASRALLAISSMSAVLGMSLALVFAASQFTETPYICLPTMARWHGPIMALGCIGCGLAARSLDGFRQRLY